MNRMLLFLPALIAGATALGGCAGNAAAATPQPAPTLTREVLTVPGGLSSPWDLAFLPDGTMLITERCAGLSIVRGGDRTRLFGAAGSQTVAADFFCAGQSGMLGVAVDPDFGGGNRFVYVFMASSATSPPRNRVLRLTLAADLRSVVDRVDIVDDIAFKDAANAVGRSGAHSGGRIRFGLVAGDRYLYVTTGDNHSGPLPQSPVAPLGGKVLRVRRRATTRRPGSTRASSPMATATCRASRFAPAPVSRSSPSTGRTTATR